MINTDQFSDADLFRVPSDSRCDLTRKSLKATESRELDAKISMSILLLHGQDREQNFTKFFTESCAAGTPNTLVRSSLLH